MLHDLNQNQNQNQDMTTQKQIRAAFWQSHPEHEDHARRWQIKTAPQNRHNADTRTAFADFVDQLHREGQITEKLAFRATL
jgi:hypothetical protein